MYCEFLSVPSGGFTPAPNCYVLSLEKDKCLAFKNCDWELDAAGETYCLDNGKVPNCPILSMDKNACVAASNCGWALDEFGNEYCAEPVENCYILSLSKNECEEAINCEWLVDARGKTLCQPGKLPSSPSSAGSTQFPTLIDGGDLTELTPGVDCLDPDLPKEDCKNAENCVWDRNQNMCLAVTQSPTPEPTLYPSQIPTSDEPTKFGHVDCEDPSLVQKECKLAPNCLWEVNQNGKNYCVFGTWPPTPSPMEPTLDPTKEPTVSCYAKWSILLFSSKNYSHETSLFTNFRQPRPTPSPTVREV